MKSDKNKRPKIAVIMEGLVIACILFFLFNSSRPNFDKRVRHDYQKECFGNQRLIYDAILMFSMDHDFVIHEYNDKIYNMLVEEKYLKDISKSLCGECEFLVEGDLSEDGYIYCLYHGSSNGQKEGIAPKISLHHKSDKKRELIEKLVEIACCTLPTIIYYLFNL